MSPFLPKMVVHQAETEDRHGHLDAGMVDGLEEALEIAIVQKDVATAIVAIDDVISDPADGGSCGAWHQDRLGKRTNIVNRKHECPLLLLYRHQILAILEAIRRTGAHSRRSTFEAFASILRSTGTKVEEVVLDHLQRDGEYYRAKLNFRHGVQLLNADLRPSDAFGLALVFDAPILVADDVLATAAHLGWTQPPPDI